MSERKKRGSGGEMDITSPPNRRSQRKSDGEKRPSDSQLLSSKSPLKRCSRGVGRSQREEKDITSPPNRRSQRKSDGEKRPSDSQIPAPVIKRSITAKKIMPRKTMPASAPVALQSTPRNLNVVAAAVPRRSSRISPRPQKENAASDKLLSPLKGVTEPPLDPVISILSPITHNVPTSPPRDDRDRVMSQKVRRSYSRLDMSLNSSSILYSPTRSSDTSSTPNLALKAARPSLFGFVKLLVPGGDEGMGIGAAQRPSDKRVAGTAKASPGEPDHNIPGVILMKEKRRKRKVLPIQKSDLDEWAATMNAEFEEAEKFDLLVE